MNRLLVDIKAGDERIPVEWRQGNGLPAPAGQATRPELLDADSLEELRWYLEDYLRVPFGVYGDRGAKVADLLPEWGSRLFRVAITAHGFRHAYAKIGIGEGPVELVIRSDSPQVLAQPWELIRDPGRGKPLALDRVAVTRSLLTAQPAAAFTAKGSRLRVLMVISRPGGTTDVGYRMIARPLLPLVDKMREKVEVSVLRPPTLSRLEEVLSQAALAGEPFQIVHFDGHGGISTGAEPSGLLIFEAPGGGLPDHVEADRVSEVLAAGQVPIVVLNACRSAHLGGRVEAAVATRLLQGGAASVIAMAYKVYAVAAAEFMAVFYEHLLAGDPVAAAVAAGRHHLAAANERPSPKGKLPLADWMVPVHYTRGDVRFPHLQESNHSRRTLEESVESVHASEVDLSQVIEVPDGNELSSAAADSFVGRDSFFYRLEVAVRRDKVVILHGMAGIGKSELARGFGRWWRDTGGVDNPDWVVWHSFEPGDASYSLAGVIDGIGRRACGPGFSLLSTHARRQAVIELLERRRVLLIWDNFESVRTMPDSAGVTPPMTQADQADLQAFVVLVQDRCASSIIITSRTSEDWLGDVRRIKVDALNQDEAVDYADQILEPLPHTRARRQQRAFGELMQWLGGHPFSMRLVLPSLVRVDPQHLLQGLSGTTPLPGWDYSAGTTSLPASITYSYTHLTPEDQQMLTVVSLFHSSISADIAGLFSWAPRTPARFRFHGEAGWAGMMDRAVDVGLLTSLGQGRYGVHPALPAYLARQWHLATLKSFERERTAATRSLLFAFAAMCDKLDQQMERGNSTSAVAVIEAHRHTLGSLLGYAIEHQLWARAQAIAQPLMQYWELRGLQEEMRGWTYRIEAALGIASGAVPDLASPSGRLWLLLAGSQANRQIAARQLDDAEHTFHAILQALQHQPRTRVRFWVYPRHLATVYNGLGRIAQHRGRWDEAENWHRQHLAVMSKLRNRTGIAISYHQLGLAAENLGRLDQAEDLYRQCLVMMEEARNRPGVAVAQHSLGRIAMHREQWDLARISSGRSLAASADRRDKASMATTYFQLGQVAQEQQQWGEATSWFQQSLIIRKDLRDQPGIASCYHQLGVIAQEQGRLDEAEDWYRQVSIIVDSIDDRPGMAANFGQRGLLAARRGHPHQALELVIRCIALFEQFPHPDTGPAPVHLHQLTAVLGVPALERSWQEVTGTSLPQKIRRFAQSPLPQTKSERKPA